MRMISQQLREEDRDDTLPIEFYRGRQYRARLDPTDVTPSEPVNTQDVLLEDGRAHIER